MKKAILVLEKEFKGMMMAQTSPENTAYVNELQLAIQILKKYDDLYQKNIEKQLLTLNNNL